jgi:hypothetical protein
VGAEKRLLSTPDIAGRLLLPHREVLSWIDPGVETPSGRLRLRAEQVQGWPDFWVVRPADLLAFFRRRDGREARKGRKGARAS